MCERDETKSAQNADSDLPPINAQPSESGARFSRETLSSRFPWIRNRFYLIALAVFLFGQVCAVTVHFVVADKPGRAVAYEIVDGKAYVVPTRESKRYRHELERFGGKAAVMADDLVHWFSGLWKGKQLPKTISFLSIGTAFVIFRAGRSRKID